MMTNTYKPIVGGLEKSIEAFTEEYRRYGHNVVVVAPAFEGTDGEERGVIRVPSMKNVHGTPFSLKFPVPVVLAEALGEFRPEVVHSHHPFLMGATALRVAHKHKVPLVFTHHTLFEQNMHYVTHGESERLTRFVVELAVGYSNLADHVIAPSASVMHMLRERGVESPIDVVPTGIDVERFASGNREECRRSAGIPSGAFVVGHIGRLAPEKNLEFTARAVARFLKKRTEAHFLLAGKGPSEDAVHAIFDEAGVSDRVHAIGIVKDQALVDAYHAIDVFAFASQSETQGLVLAEAFSAGVPVVAVDACGVRDIVVDLTSGRLLPAEDEETFAGALEWAADLSPEARSALREACLKTAAEYSMPRSAAKALEVYSRLTRRSRRRTDAAGGKWATTMRVLKAEWKIFKNIGKATKESLAKKESTEAVVV